MYCTCKLAILIACMHILYIHRTVHGSNTTLKSQSNENEVKQLLAVCHGERVILIGRLVLECKHMHDKVRVHGREGGPEMSFTSVVPAN